MFPNAVGCCVSTGFWLYYLKYYLPDLVSVGYQIAVVMVVFSSELLRGVAGAVTSAARDIARLAFNFELASVSLL